MFTAKKRWMARLYATLFPKWTARLIYALADRLPVVEDEKVSKTSAKMLCKAVLDTLAARETEVKAHTPVNTVSDLKGIETLDTLSDTVAENEVESLGDKEVEVNAKALDYLNG